MNPILHWPGLNACPFPIDEIQGLRVGRTAELGVCTEALLAKRHNLLVYGDRGIGKTFLVRLLAHELGVLDSEVLPIFANMTELAALSPTDKVSAFPRSVVLHACARLWQLLTKRSYLELRESLRGSGSELKSQSSAEAALKKIYRHLMDEAPLVHFEEGSEVGLTGEVKGSRTEKRTRELRQPELLPFEFLEFVNEINATVLPEVGKGRVVIICDEANWLPAYDQQDILERYLELFAARNIQFVFVAGFVPWQSVPNLPACFETLLELEGLDKISICSLIQKVGERCGIEFSPAALSTLWQYCEGHPRLTLSSGARAHQMALEKAYARIDKRLAKAACESVRRESERYLRSLYPVIGESAPNLPIERTEPAALRPARRSSA